MKTGILPLYHGTAHDFTEIDVRKGKPFKDFGLGFYLDIVIGPTANDDTRASIRAVMNAANGAILSGTALDLLIRMLEPDNLPEQYYFGTNKSAGLLKFKGRNELK